MKVIFVLLLVLGKSVVSYGQQSDFEIVERFKTESQQLNFKIKNAINSNYLIDLQLELDSLESEFNIHKNLLDRALFPNKAEEILSDLQLILVNNENRLIVIESQREQIFELSNQLTAHRSEITRLYVISDSLKKEITESQASEAHLSEMIRTYREKVEKRDRLIFEMIDSLLLTDHNAVIANHINEIDQTENSLTVSQNLLSWIESVINRNIEVATSANSLLAVEDHLRLYALQTHFENAWNQVGDEVVSTYGGQNKTEWGQKIESAISEWKILSSHKMWRSVDQYLTYNEIDLATFDNKESFFIALDSFIDHQIEESKSDYLTSNSYQTFQQLASFWNSTFKNDWLINIDQNNLLTTSQVQFIDAKLLTWEQESRPIHPMLIAIISIMIVSLTGFIIVMSKTRTSK